MNDASAAGSDDGLRSKVLQGGWKLFLRQALGLVLSVGGVLVMTRFIGPAAYGIYSAAFGMTFFAQTTGELSLDVYLVRYAGELSKDRCDQVFTLLLALAGATTIILVVITPIVGSVVRLAGFEPVALVMFLSVPAVHLQQVHLSRLERGLDYRAISVVELGAQVAYFLVALPLSIVLRDAWAPVAGWWVQQVLQLGGFWYADRYRPRLIWDRSAVSEALAYGAIATSSNFVYSLRNLVVPVFGSRILGAAGVGYVSLAVRLAQQLGFVQQVILRISVAVLAKIADDRDRLRRALTQAAELQVLAFGIPIALFSLIAGTVVPIVFGRAWTPVAELVPLLAPPSIAAAVFQPVNAAMSLRRRPWELVVSQGSSALLLWLAAILLVPSDGIRGYGYAEMIAMASWLFTDRLMIRHLPRPRYGFVLLWWSSLSAVALAPVTTWWLVLAAPLAALIPGSVHEITKLAASLITRRGTAARSPG